MASFSQPDEVPEVNCSVNEEKCKIQYDIDSKYLKDLKKDNFSFEISSPTRSEELGVFKAVNNDGSLLRQNKSKPFPNGTFTKPSIDFKKGKQFIVKVKKSSKDVKLREYFEN